MLCTPVILVVEKWRQEIGSWEGKGRGKGRKKGGGRGVGSSSIQKIEFSDVWEGEQGIGGKVLLKSQPILTV